MNSAVNPQVTPEFKDRFQEAVDLKNQGRLAEAEQKFHDLLVMNPVSASVHAFLADTLWDQGLLTRAIASFQKAIELAPKSEMASLGLFHSLLESGDKAGAIAEMNRFLRLSDSEEYRVLAQQFGHESSRLKMARSLGAGPMTSVPEARPEKFWHCSVRLIGGKRNTVVNDLSFADLQRQIIEPWHRGVAFPVSGLVVASRDQVEQIKITHTGQPLSHYQQEHSARNRSSGILDLATNTRMLPIWHGTDYTHELLFASLSAAIPEPEVGLVLRLCERLPAAARILITRRKGKTPFEISDEYDVQDLLQAVLRAYLKYTVHEEPLGKVGGARSGRADVAIEELGTVVELKFVHTPDDQKRIVDEYANDLLLYTKWPHLKHFIYLVYNAQDLRDPEALEKLAGPQTINGVTFTAHIVLA